MSRRGAGNWRNRAATDLLIRFLEGRDLSGRVLVMEDPLTDLEAFLKDRGADSTFWGRRALKGRPASPWPPPGPFRSVVFRLPRAKEEVLMGLHAAASVLLPGGSILVYGAKDEGIRPALGPLGEIFSGTDTVAVGGRSRVLQGFWSGDRPELKDSLDAWKAFVTLDHPSLPVAWISYPGVFAHGRLDPGTRLLLDALPDLPSKARVLDFGCGSGLVGAAAQRKGSGVKVELLDVDALALEAARENVPGARLILTDGLPPRDEGPYDAILSNPPFHRGKSEDPGMVTSLIEMAPGLLSPEGRLVLVAQRRLALEGALKKSFRKCSALRTDRTFVVWEGRGPRGSRKGAG
jgi:16S rRNA (guanine1207-N2)-methyltransferase